MPNCVATDAINTDMYDLYIGNKNYSSWSLRPWVLMHEVNIPFRERQVVFGADRFSDFSPTGKVPCLVDGATTVWDSLAITEYLGERHANVWPAEAPARAWARSAAAEMHSGFFALRDVCTMNCGIRVKLKAVSPALQRDLARLEELWAEGIGRFGGPFLTGARFCAADAFYAPVAFRIQTYEPPINVAARRYAAQLLALPSMERWYAAALTETWRDEPHEAEARAVGEWTADHRAKAAS
jgi:glutathione S-transferase